MSIGALPWAIRLFSVASLLAFVYWLLVVIGWFLLLAILFAITAYVLLRVDVARNPVYHETLPRAVDDGEVEEQIVPRATVLGIPMGFTRRQVRLPKKDSPRQP